MNNIKEVCKKKGGYGWMGPYEVYYFCLQIIWASYTDIWWSVKHMSGINFIISIHNTFLMLSINSSIAKNKLQQYHNECNTEDRYKL